jgi:hypothetical protein
MNCTEDIFSDSLALFNNGDDILLEPPTEVQYGPIRSKIVRPRRSPDGHKPHAVVPCVALLLMFDLLVRCPIVARDGRERLHNACVADLQQWAGV